MKKATILNEEQKTVMKEMKETVNAFLERSI
jgi:hypothetical protein